MQPGNDSADAASKTSWHQRDVDESLTRLKSSANGLSTQEAETRLQIVGPNTLPVVRGRSALLRFLQQFHNVLIYVLVLASLITAMLGHWVDASVIFGVVLINALIGFIQEGKAEEAIEAIRNLLSPQALVLRDNSQVLIVAEDLVPGDIVLLQPGDKVPADLRLIQVKGLAIQEAAITGESVPVEKSIEPVNADSVLGDRFCMAYSGTLVTQGQGRGLVVATGKQTEIGRISQLVSDVRLETTPLLRQIARFGRRLTVVIGVIAVATFWFGYWLRHYSLAELFLASVSIAVAAIPEGLPAIMTITLAIGVQRMAKRHAIIRKLPGVETLGAVSVICTDKTGTLTRNEMTVREVITASASYRFEGTGYAPTGGYQRETESGIKRADSLRVEDSLTSTEPMPVDLARLLEAAILCNDAALEQEGDEWRVNGDPMEGALLTAGLKAGLDLKQLKTDRPRLDVLPFDSGLRYMATLHLAPAKSSDTSSDFPQDTAGTILLVKGAPERLIEMCRYQLDAHGERQPVEIDEWLRAVDKLAAAGQRVLAFAMKSCDANTTQIEEPSDSDLVLLGLAGFIDPPRDEAIQAVAECAGAGIRVKMITGDHAETAMAIARQIGLVNPDDALTGQMLDQMSDDELCKRVQSVDVYARVSPEHKLRLVELLQAQGLIVAMTGDGVNDAPALKRADVGIAMGKNGTEAAKEAAVMVLADDNFASITAAVEEGRTVYDNLRKSILFILPSSGGESLIILFAVLAGFSQLPLTPVQILWVNMVTTVTLALTLAFEPSEADLMRHPPRDPAEPILSRFLIWRVLFVSLIILVGTLGLYQWQLTQTADIDYARTVAVNSLVMFEIVYLFNSRYLTAPVLNWRGFSGNRTTWPAILLLLVLQLGFTYLAPLQQLFGSVPIDAISWLPIVAVAICLLLIVEAEKWLIRLKNGT